jgi:hypothetical protein
MKKLFLLALPFILFSCSSDDDAEIIIPTSPQGNAVAYFRGNVDGVATDYTYNYNAGSAAYGYSNSAEGFPGENWYSYGGFIGTPDYSKGVTIYCDNMYFGGSQGESEDFYNTFETVPTNYLTNAQIDAHVKGIEIEYQKNGDGYRSSNGSQTGSTFVVTSVSEGIEEGGTEKIKTIIGTFNCKVYNDDNVADAVTITNGSFKVILKEDLF